MAVPIDLIRRLRTVATAEGVQEVVRELQTLRSANVQVAESSNVVSLATKKAEQAQLSAQKAWEVTQRRVDAARRDLEGYRRDVVNVANALSQGIASQEEANRIIDLAAIKYRQLGDSVDALTQKQADYDRRARSLRESLDPVYAAQNKFNAALYEAEDLFTGGAVDMATYTAAVERATKQLRDARIEVVQLAKAQADQKNAAFSSWFVGPNASTAGAPAGAADSAFGDGLDQLQAKFDPLFRVQQDYKKDLAELKRALDVGAISEKIYAERLDERKSAFTGLMREMGRVSAAERARAADTDAAAQREKSAADAAAAQAALQQRVDSYSRAVDPAYAAQQRFNAAIFEAEDLYTSGALSVERYRQGVDKATQDLRDFEAAQRKAGEAIAAAAQQQFNSRFGIGQSASSNGAPTGADTSAFGDALDNLRGKFLPLEKAAHDYAAAVDEINDLARKGVLTADEQTGAIARQEAAYRRQVKAIEESGNGASKNFRLTGYELTNLSYQLNDMVTMLASGSSPFQVLATQGGQVYQVLSGTRGGLMAGIRGLGASVLGLITPVTAAAAGLLGLGVAATFAYTSWLQGQQKLDIALSGMGRTTKATIGDLESIAIAGADLAKISVGSARDLTAQFAATGKIDPAIYDDLIKSAKDYARIMGMDLPDAGAKFAQAFADPLKGAEELDKQLNFLDQSTLEYIRTLTSSNKKQEAARVILEKLRDVLPDANERLSVLARAWNSVAAGVSNAWNWLGRGISRVVDGPAEEEAYQAAKKRVADLQNLLSNPWGKMFSDRNKKEMEAAQQFITQYEQKVAQQQAAATRAAEQEAVKQAAAVAKQRDPRIEQLEELIRVRGTLTAALNKPGADTDKFQMMLEGINNQIYAITDANEKLLPVADQLRKRREMEIKVINATTEASRISAQAALDDFDAKARGADNAVAGAEAENKKILAQTQFSAQLSQAQRERVLAAQQSAQAQQLEIDLIGKSAGEQATLRANFQAYADLQREAIQAGTPFDERRYQELIKYNEAMGKLVDTTARVNLREAFQFELDQLGRSDLEQRVAATMRSYGLGNDTNSPDAALVRTVEQLKDFRDISKEAFSGFLQDLRSGVSAADSLRNAFTRLSDRIADAALNDAVNSLFGGSGLGALFGMAGTRPGQGGNANPIVQIAQSSIQAVGDATGSAAGVAFGDLLKPATGANGQSLGFLSSPAGSMVGAGITGAAIGYSTQNPLIGGIGGAASGLAAGIAGGPIGMAIGAIVGGLAGGAGGIFGKSSAEKQEKQQAQQAYTSALPSINLARASWRGEAEGGLGQQIAQINKEWSDAWTAAMKAGNTSDAIGIWTDRNTGIQRAKDRFIASFDGMLQALENGLGTNSPFAASQKSMLDLREQLVGFVSDARTAGLSVQDVARAQVAAREAALSVLAGAEQFSEVQTEMQRISGAAASLGQVLQDLGMSAADAGRAVSDGVAAAMDKLRTKFADDLGRRLNDALDQGYVNDAADLVKQRQTDLADASSLGIDPALVERVFAAEAQKIVDGAELAGQGLQDLIARFPELAGVVHDFAQSAADAASRLLSYQDRLFAAQNPATLGGQIAAMERQFAREREQEVAVGGRYLVDLEAAQLAERVKLLADYYDQVAQRERAYQDRAFTAGLDTSSLSGQLAAFDRKAAQEREQEAKAGGEAMVALERALAAERLQVERNFAQQQLDTRRNSARSGLDDARNDLSAAYQRERSEIEKTQQAWEGFGKSFKDFREGLKLDDRLTTLGAGERLGEAQRQYEDVLRKTLAGDTEAAAKLASVSQEYLNLARDFHGPSEDYARIFTQVNSALELAQAKAGQQVDVAKAQLDSLKAQVSHLIDINDSVLSVADAVRALQKAQAANDSVRDWGLNPTRNKNIAKDLDAAGISYGGNFPNGQFMAWVDSLAPDKRDKAMEIANSWLWMNYRDGGIVGRFAAGGVVGNGIWNTDSVLARYAGGGNIALAGGEYVMPAPRTSMYRPELEAMRAGTYSNDNGAVVSALRSVDASVRQGLTETCRILAQEVRSLKAQVAELLAEQTGEIRRGNRDQKQAETRPGAKSTHAA